MAVQTEIIVSALNHELFPAIRVITLNPNKPTIPVGRASRSLCKALRSEVNNAWFDSPVMSRNHAEISLDLEKKTLMIQDTGSMHGTFVNYTRLKIHTLTTLRDGDLVIFGSEVKRGSETFPPCKFVFNFKIFPYRKTNTFAFPDSSDLEDTVDRVKGSDIGSSEAELMFRGKRESKLYSPQPQEIRQTTQTIDLDKDEKRSQLLKLILERPLKDHEVNQAESDSSNLCPKKNQNSEIGCVEKPVSEPLAHNLVNDDCKKGFYGPESTDNKDDVDREDPILGLSEGEATRDGPKNVESDQGTGNLVNNQTPAIRDGEDSRKIGSSINVKAEATETGVYYRTGLSEDSTIDCRLLSGTQNKGRAFGEISGNCTPPRNSRAEYQRELDLKVAYFSARLANQRKYLSLQKSEVDAENHSPGDIAIKSGSDALPEAPSNLTPKLSESQIYQHRTVPGQNNSSGICMNSVSSHPSRIDLGEEVRTIRLKSPEPLVRHGEKVTEIEIPNLRHSRTSKRKAHAISSDFRKENLTRSRSHHIKSAGESKYRTKSHREIAKHKDLQTDSDYPPLKRRKIFENIRYVALGGVAAAAGLFSVLVATAPEFP